ncbi:MAG: SMC-Scp complex subunit ScpB [Deltaproteobacteria bacterium]|nr:SMC-Scp complex subunit ScpB [Deltaproteobacteria bacterium]
MDKDNLKPLIESLIFASEGVLTINGICALMPDEDRAAVKAALGELIEDYRNRAGGLLIEEVAGGYQFRTNPEFSAWVRRLFKSGAQKLSRPALETLAIVAYKQPVMRAELEAVRGVDSGGVLATLMDKRLIKIVGKKEVPGRPVVYGTTKEFLETFDLKDLGCLPSLKDIQALEEENAGQGQKIEQAAGAPEEGTDEGPEAKKDEESEAGTDEGPGADPEGRPETGTETGAEDRAEDEADAGHEAPAEAGGEAAEEEKDPSAGGSFEDAKTGGGEGGRAPEAPEGDSNGRGDVKKEG